MPGLIQNESNGKGSPTKRKRLSLKFFQKKEAKRALDFTEKQENEHNTSEPKRLDKCDKTIPGAQVVANAIDCEKKEEILPFVGLNNLGNTCYLNSVLQVLYYCPGFKTRMEFMYDIITMKQEIIKSEDPKTDQIQASYLLNAKNYTERELAIQPKRLMGTLRELNPMYDGYLQHDAQEVLQCILGYILEACQLLKNNKSAEEKIDPETNEENMLNRPTEISSDKKSIVQDDHEMPDLEKEQIQKKKKNGKRKSDPQVGNPMKRSKLPKDPNHVEGKGQTRGKRKPSGDHIEQAPDMDVKNVYENGTACIVAEKKIRLGLRFAMSSKICSLGKLTSNTNTKGPNNDDVNGHSFNCGEAENEDHSTNSSLGYTMQCVKEIPCEKNQDLCEVEDVSTCKTELTGFDLMDGMFQGQLVLRTRCLECECYSERRENFQDISVPVQENDPKERDSEISPEPKMEIKTLKWAISQFASVERIVGEDKYFCENCHHYTEAERSLLFDKMPEVVTIHLKCFAACNSELEPYGNLSKVNTPLLTPLTLSLEEWSTKEANDNYELFAVVMHNGVSISSGHYTAYIKMTYSGSHEVHKEESALNCAYGVKQESLSEEDAKNSVCSHEFDDGEISVKLKGNFQTSGKMTKKNAESVGLLGGQKNISNFDLYGSKNKNDPENPGFALKENDKSDSVNFEDKHNCFLNNQSSINSQHGELKTQRNGPENNIPQSCCGLQKYEGKWMLFDDAEVKFTDEQDFLSSLSPSTSCASTPYLLFYKKMVNP
ncbi:ubiquitin carboxyl-terminal hydrolase 1 isoform X2 [Narcine bancroftii]|uniref:ubiquitin carboxyl-terminal hydrolase 1 isoform X2 n=1 Tax=Narcine bancroftii TaxID=1343680 RepID=UPI003831A9BD